MATQWDLWVDYHRTDGDGLTHTRLKDVERPLDLRPGMFVIVGDHLDLVAHRRSTAS